MDWVMIGTITTIIGVIVIPVIFASIRFGKSIGKMETEIKELRNLVQLLEHLRDRRRYESDPS